MGEDPIKEDQSNSSSSSDDEEVIKKMMEEKSKSSSEDEITMKKIAFQRRNSSFSEDPSEEVALHSSQFQCFCSTKSSSEMLQNLPYFIYYTKTQSCFIRISFGATLFFSLMNATWSLSI